MSDFEQKVVLGQELDINQYIDSTSSGTVTALPVANESSVSIQGAVTALQGILGSGRAQSLILINNTGSAFTVQNNNAGATAANRILTGTGADVSLPNGAAISFYYSITALRWVVANSGAQGPQGFQGNQGVTGAQGFQGVAGAQGNQGFQGLTGSQGAQGFQGLTGAQGFQGLTGAQGNQGFQGVPGTVPVSAPNDGTNATYVGSGQYPASNGATATNSQASTVSVASTSVMLFTVMVGNNASGAASWALCAADYASSNITVLSDIAGIMLLVNTGTGIYVSKSATSDQLTFQNLNLGSVVVTIQFLNAAITGTSVWA